LSKPAAPHIEAVGRRCNAASRIAVAQRREIEPMTLSPRSALACRIGHIALVGLALVIATGCTRIKNHQGFIIDQTLLATVSPGVDNKESVAKTLGRPSFAGTFSDNDWYYVSRDTRQFGFSNPKPTGQTLIHVKFDDAGNVAAVDKSGLEKVASVSPSGDKTPTLGRERGFFAELFGNIGRVGGGPSVPTADNPN
jgi:outer membrane protein assembly factor BamE (lipoprotein component of BamABCDE complex)